jgi:PHD/YefM family antitoxin component YafN of YafNO toxin-antitoxin module
MVALHPRALTENGQQFVMIPREEFDALEEEIEQIRDLIAFAEAEAESGTAPRITWEKLKGELGLKFN